jgi:hypothetical protein
VIFPVAPIYGFFFRSIAILEPVQDTQTDRSGAVLPAQDAALGPSTPPWQGVETVTTRWVLKGYELRPVGVWYPMVNPGWDHCVDNDPAEIHDRAVREEESRAVRRREPPEPARLDPLQQQPHHPTALEELAASLAEPRPTPEGGAS